jgi:hypothetical protein
MLFNEWVMMSITHDMRMILCHEPKAQNSSLSKSFREFAKSCRDAISKFLSEFIPRQVLLQTTKLCNKNILIIIVSTSYRFHAFSQRMFINDTIRSIFTNDTTLFENRHLTFLCAKVDCVPIN